MFARPYTLWNWIYEAVFQIGEAGFKLFVTKCPELGAISHCVSFNAHTDDLFNSPESQNSKT